MQRDPLCRDLLNSESSRRQCAASRDLVPPLYPLPCFLLGGVQSSGGPQYCLRLSPFASARVEFSGHQQFGPAGALSNSREYTLDGIGVLRREVASDNVPLLLPFHHLDSDNIGSELLQRLDRKPRQHAVKH